MQQLKGPKTQRWKNDWQIQEVLRYLKKFLLNPVQQIRTIPDWHWSTLIIMQFCLALISGACYGLVSQSFLKFIAGIIVMPVSSLLVAFVATGFLYYSFLLFNKTALNLRQLFTVVVLVTVPFFIFHIVAELVPPIDLIGFAFAGILLIVGLIENFHLPKKLVIRIVIFIYAMFFVVWVVGRIQTTREREWQKTQFTSGKSK